MPNPKRRHSKSRTAKRRTHDALTPTQTSDCPNCREPKPPHRACPHCGYYRGRQVRAVPEVCRVFCATANPTEVVIGETGQGRGILGVVDGFPPLGIESDDDIAGRKALLREFGYKG